MPRPQGHPSMTARRIQVLSLVSEGLSNREIGERLELGVATIKQHLVYIFWMLGAQDRAHAVALGIRAGYLPQYWPSISRSTPTAVFVAVGGEPVVVSSDLPLSECLALAVRR